MSERGGSSGGRGCFRTGCVLFFLLAAAVVVVVALWLGGQFEAGVPSGSVLVVRLDGELPDHSERDFLSLLEGPQLDLLSVRRALVRAASDPRVAGVLLQIVDPQLEAADAEELWETLESVRESGKFVVAHIDGADLLDWLVATAADEILLDRSSSLEITGLSLEAFFLGDALARWGIRADLVRVGSYKGSYEQLTAAGPSAEFDESMDSLVASTFDSVIERAARARTTSPERLRSLIDRAPFAAERAREERLVDRLVWGDEVRGLIESRVEGEGPTFLSAMDYLRRSSGGESEQHIAVIPLRGMILDGESSFSLLGFVSGAETLVKALREATDDDDVVGILLRIDSPGGSVAAAQKVWRAVRQASSRKPVVACLGGMAASGGYYVAVGAERIIAQPTTVTGSIGVFGGKLVFEDLLSEQQVGVKSYSRGERAGMFSSTAGFAEDERQAFKGLLESAYKDFVSRVALARERAFEEIDAVARGRVWSGRDALDAGLVDLLGGFDDAVDEVRKLARFPAARELELRVYPRAPGLLDLFSPGASEPFVRGSPAGAAAGILRDRRSIVEAFGRHDDLLGPDLRLALMPFLIEVRAE